MVTLCAGDRATFSTINLTGSGLPAAWVAGDRDVSPDQVRAFLARGPDRRAVILGVPLAEWEHPRILVIGEGEPPEGLRRALRWATAAP